jgi:hypothetical protein
MTTAAAFSLLLFFRRKKKDYNEKSRGWFFISQMRVVLS